VQLPEEVRDDAAALGVLPIATDSGRTWAARPGGRAGAFGRPSEINRSDLSRTVTVTANLSGVTLGEVLPAINAADGRADLPPATA
jgi:HAE1 family hydrophobic/amphiphilic exporter-1